MPARLRPAIYVGLAIIALTGFAMIVKYGHDSRPEAVPAHLKAADPH